MRSFPTAEFADSGQRYPGFAYNDALQVAKIQRVPMLYPHAGSVWRTDDGLTLTFIGPSLPLLTHTRNDVNNNSLAFILQYGNFRMLFTGDAGAEAEQRFLSEGIDLHVDVLKVGHHGSTYGSTPRFISVVHPAYTIISVGRHNLFGHPAPSTIETLQGFGARVYRTDENGAVTVTTDGRKTTVMVTIGVMVSLSNHPEYRSEGAHIEGRTNGTSPTRGQRTLAFRRRAESPDICLSDFTKAVYVEREQPPHVRGPIGI